MGAADPADLRRLRHRLRVRASAHGKPLLELCPRRRRSICLHAVGVASHPALLRQLVRGCLYGRHAYSVGGSAHPSLPSGEFFDDRRRHADLRMQPEPDARRRGEPGARRFLQRGCRDMSVIHATYFDGKTSVRRLVTLLVGGGKMKIVGADVNLEVEARLVRRSLRIGDTPRWLYLPGGGACVTSDNAAIDRITRDMRYEKLLHRWESRPHYAVLAVFLVVSMLWLLVDRGVPTA